MNEERLIYSAKVCSNVVNLYRNLLNSYVSDFYVENHWEQKLPISWKEFLEKINFTQLGELLTYEKRLVLVAPLSFLCVRKILNKFSVSRRQAVISKPLHLDDAFTKFLWKRVKLKKQHEIEIMARLCYQMAIKTNCFNIVDIGSGLGHLSRLLAFGYGFNVCTFEANDILVKKAPILDVQFEKLLRLKKVNYFPGRKLIHNHKRIKETLSGEDMENLIRKVFNEENNNFKFGIVGLHPCGNLGSSLLHIFNTSSSATFLNMASCCYMKLTLDSDLTCEFSSGFPLSSFYKNLNYKLDYLSCETACHAIENYVKKIKTEESYQLKIHAFRAALESLLVKTNDNLRHCATSNVRYEKMLTFEKYCSKALGKSNITFSSTDIALYEELIENTWRNVVKYYSVRLLFAPLVESIILFDRLLYIKENRSNCQIIPAFDCEISPRNHVLIGQK